VQAIDLATTEKSGIDFEGRILRRGADQRDQPAFDGVQQGILLCLVEAVDLVDEEEETTSLPSLTLGTLQHFTEFLHARFHGRKAFHGHTDRRRKGMGERRLARPRRTPQDDGRQLSTLGEHPQRPTLTEKVVLSGNGLDIMWPGTFGEWRIARRTLWGGRRRIIEKGIHRSFYP